MSLRISVLFALMMAIGLLTGLRLSHAEPTAATTNFTGVISQVSGDRITIQSSGHTNSFAMPHGTPIKVNGQPAAASDLKVGMTAIVISTDGITAAEIRAYLPATTNPATEPTTKPVASTTFTGSITQVRGDGLTLESPPHTASFSFNHNTKISVNGQPATGADLKVGMKAIVISTDGKSATEIRAYSPTTTKPTTEPTTKPVASTTFTGSITQVRGDGLTLESPPHTASFSFNHNTKITVNGQAGDGR